MKTFLFLAAASLGTLFIASPVRAQSPDATTQHLSQVKALLNDLLKQADPAAKPTPPPQTQLAQTPSQNASPETLVQLQKLLAQLLGNVKAETDSDTPDPAPAAAAANGQKAAPTSSTGLNTPSLTTPSLNSAHLMPSGPLDGRGTKGGTPRLSDADWHQLFSKQK
jgi:hypothetical protein